MSYLLAPIGNGAQFFTVNGLPLNGGYINTYLAGTTTAAATYTTSSGSTANTNPIVLGTDGRPPQEIWLASGTNYKFVLSDSTGSVIQTYDNLYGIPTTLTSSNQVPSGCILLWSGSIASIPSGYYLCNGQNGTPNLQDSFIVGAGNTYGVANNGGFTSSVASNTGTNKPLYYALAYIQKS